MGINDAFDAGFRRSVMDRFCKGESVGGIADETYNYAEDIEGIIREQIHQLKGSLMEKEMLLMEMEDKLYGKEKT